MPAVDFRISIPSRPFSACRTLQTVLFEHAGEGEKYYADHRRQRGPFYPRERFVELPDISQYRRAARRTTWLRSGAAEESWNRVTSSGVFACPHEFRCVRGAAHGGVLGFAQIPPAVENDGRRLRPGLGVDLFDQIQSRNIGQPDTSMTIPSRYLLPKDGERLPAGIRVQNFNVAAADNDAGPSGGAPRHQ